VTATQTTPRLGSIGDYLTGLAERPPLTPDAHQEAAATLLRYAAAETRKTLNDRRTDGNPPTLIRLATAHIRLAAIARATADPQFANL
jgi:hypothetical protein